MKRYRICCFDFDGRANLLNRYWSPEAKKNIGKQIQQVQQSIINEYGQINAKEKIERFKEMGVRPFSIISYHNILLEQIRKSYVQGGFYASLVGACTLGERILNHLILDLRDYYKNDSKKQWETHPCKDCNKFRELLQKGLIRTYFDIFTCKSCSNWNLMISNLVQWGIISLEVELLFKELSNIRHKSIHFNEKTVMKLKEGSLESIKKLQDIIQKLFPAFGSDYFIPAKGEAYLKKELESKPFFKKYYLPNSQLVTPFHKVKQVMPRFIIEDISTVEDKDISDEKFIKLREDFLKKKEYE